MPEQDGTVVVVTGAASGIGRAVARTFAAAGASVVVADVDEDGAKQVAVRINAEIDDRIDDRIDAGTGGRALAVRCDVTDLDQVRAAVAAAVDTFGRLDVMVNNAGICVLGPLHELDGADFDRMIAVNLKGTWHGIKAAVPHLPRGGSIISVASTAGLNGAPLIGGYGATKAGIVNLTKTASAELRPAGIRVNCVCPAFTETPFSDALIAGFEAATGGSAQEYFAAKQGRLGQPEDVAKIVLHLASDDAAWVTGTAYTVDGGLMAASI